MRESIPKKSRSNASLDLNSTSLGENVDKPANNTNIALTPINGQIYDDFDVCDTITPKTSNKFSKDAVLGGLLKQVRLTKDSLLFAMLTNIKDYELVGNDFVVTCDHLVNFQDLNDDKTKENLNKLIKKIDSSLTFQVKLVEDNQKEKIAKNVKKLKEIFGKYIKFVE